MFLKPVTKNKHLNIEVSVKIFTICSCSVRITSELSRKKVKNGLQVSTFVLSSIHLTISAFLLFVPASDHRLRPPYSCTFLKIILLQPLPIPLKVFTRSPVRFGTTSKNQAHLWRDSRALFEEDRIELMFWQIPETRSTVGFDSLC